MTSSVSLLRKREVIEALRRGTVPRRGLELFAVGMDRFERSFGSFSRSFQLPENTDPEKIEAKYTDGVLTVRVPKVEESKPRKIEVEVS